MCRFYTVDRQKSLKQGQIIKLVHYNDIEPEKLQKHADLLFTSGFSSHGEKYFVRSQIRVEFLKSEINANRIKTNSESKYSLLY